MCGYCWFSQIAQEAPKLRVILLVLTVLTLAAAGYPVKGRSPVVFDQAWHDIRISGGIARNGYGVLQLTRTLLVSIGPHEILLAIVCLSMWP